MVARVLFVLAGAAGLVGLGYILLSEFAVRVIENGVTRHKVAGAGIMRGAQFLGVALLLAIIALVLQTP
jgi:hypothetical protein